MRERESESEREIVPAKYAKLSGWPLADNHVSAKAVRLTC